MYSRRSVPGENKDIPLCHNIKPGSEARQGFKGRVPETFNQGENSPEPFLTSHT
jgi:hypothetical protein